MENKTHKKQIYPALESLSLEELEDILRHDFYADEKLDMDYTLAILEVIEKRESEKSDYKAFDVKAGWNDFEENYMSKNSAYSHLAPPDDILKSAPEISEKPRLKMRKPKRLIAVAAVMVVLFGMLTAQAFGFPIFQSIARWTADIFTFNGNVAPPSNDISIELPPDVDYGSLQEALDDIGVTLQLVPTWIPDGFVQSQLTITQISELLLLDAYFEYEEQSFSISVTIYLVPQEGVAQFHEINHDSVSRHEINEIVHYVMSNYERNVAIWMNENAEVAIQGDITEADLLRMINSIYGG
jgi:hypothetical protein